MKKILSLILVITFASTLSGCFGKSESRITTEDVKNRVIGEAEEYLKENYPDDTFTYVSGRSPNWAYPYYELAFSSAEYDYQELTVFAEPDEKLKNDEGLTVYHYCDNYFQYYMKDEAEEYFYNVAKEYLGDDLTVEIDFWSTFGASAKVNNEIGFLHNATNNNLSCYVTYTVYNDESDILELKKIFKTISEKIASSNMKTSVFYIFNEGATKDSATYITYDIENGVAKEKNYE